MALLERKRGICLSHGRGSPTIENSQPIASTSPKRNSARRPMGRASIGTIAAVKSSATLMTGGMTGRKSIGELPKVGEFGGTRQQFGFEVLLRSSARHRCRRYALNT